MLKQVKQNSRLIWTSLDRSGKRRIAHGTYKLLNGKVIKFNKGVYVKSKSTLQAMPNTNASLSKKGIQNKPTILSTKVALQNSLNDLQKSYALFLRNPNDIKTRGILNNALENATIKAKGLMEMTDEQENQKPPKPPPQPSGPSPEQGPQGGNKINMTDLYNIANSLLADISRAKNISNMTYIMSNASSLALNTKIHTIKIKAQDLAII